MFAKRLVTLRDVFLLTDLALYVNIASSIRRPEHFTGIPLNDNVYGNIYIEQ